MDLSSVEPKPSMDELHNVMTSSSSSPSSPTFDLIKSIPHRVISFIGYDLLLLIPTTREDKDLVESWINHNSLDYFSPIPYEKPDPDWYKTRICDAIPEDSDFLSSIGLSNLEVGRMIYMGPERMMTFVTNPYDRLQMAILLSKMWRAGVFEEFLLVDAQFPDLHVVRTLESFILACDRSACISHAGERLEEEQTCHQSVARLIANGYIDLSEITAQCIHFTARAISKWDDVKLIVPILESRSLYFTIITLNGWNLPLSPSNGILISLFRHTQYLDLRKARSWDISTKDDLIAIISRFPTQIIWYMGDNTTNNYISSDIFSSLTKDIQNIVDNTHREYLNLIREKNW